VRDTLAVELCQQAPQRRARLVAAVGQQQQQRQRLDLARQKMHEFEAAVVAPMQILDHQQRLFAGHASEKVVERREQAPFMRFGLERLHGLDGLWRRQDAGQQPQQLAHQRRVFGFHTGRSTRKMEA